MINRKKKKKIKNKPIQTVKNRMLFRYRRKDETVMEVTVILTCRAI